AQARYAARPPLALTSRLIVDGARPKSAAIWVYDDFAARAREMSSRSPRVSAPGRTADVRDGIPPYLRRTRSTVSCERPTATATSREDCPAANRSQISRSSSRDNGL